MNSSVSGVIEVERELHRKDEEEPQTARVTKSDTEAQEFVNKLK